MREREHIERLLAAHQGRLAELELQEARTGYSTPPEVETEIAQIRASIARLTDVLGAPLPRETIRALNTDDRYQSNIAHQMRTEATLYTIQREMREMRRMLYSVIGAFLVLATYVVARGFG